LYADIKGIKEPAKHVDFFIGALNLEEFKDTYCEFLSGGCKRKLCVAIAMIGNSKLKFFD
jgi:ABC-type multidrug transport system ATPase subunit